MNEDSAGRTGQPTARLRAAEPREAGDASAEQRGHGGLCAELLGFAAAGLCAYAVDLGLFVWLRGPVGLDPLAAKALSFVAACAVAYAGNALGTYRARTPARTPSAPSSPAHEPPVRVHRTVPRRARLRRFTLFFAVNLAGAAVQLSCLAVSHYGLGLTSQRADTVSGAGVGMALATALRFWGTRTLVFTARPARRTRPAAGERAPSRQLSAHRELTSGRAPRTAK